MPSLLKPVVPTRVLPTPTLPNAIATIPVEASPLVETVPLVTETLPEPAVGPAPETATIPPELAPVGEPEPLVTLTAPPAELGPPETAKIPTEAVFIVVTLPLPTV